MSFCIFSVFPIFPHKKSVFAYTYRMKKRFFPLIFCAILPLLLSCKTPPLAQNSVERITIITKPPEKKDEFWDVSHIDVSGVNTNNKLVSFTFDDAPAKHLEELIAVFVAFNEQNPDCKASATLFCNGKRIDNHTATALKMATALGFELGNHSFSHADLTALSKNQLIAEIDETDKLLKSIDGKERHLLRAPYGKLNDLVKQTAKTPIIDWTVDTLDWTGKSAEKIYQAVISKVYSGAIVLFHDGYLETVTAVKRLLPDLKQAGYQVVSVSKLAKAHACPLKNGSVYIRARKKSE